MKVKGYIQPKKEIIEEENIPENLLSIVELIDDVQNIQKNADDTLQEVKEVIEEVKQTAKEEFQKIDDKLKDIQEENSQFFTDIQDQISKIKGEPGENGTNADEEKITESVLSKIPKFDEEKFTDHILSIVPKLDESKLLKRFLTKIPKQKSDLKIIQENVETDPMSVIDKIMAMPDFKLKSTQIDGLEQTIRAFHTQLGRGYIHGGGISNITGLIQAGTNVTITGAGTTTSPYIINSTGAASPLTTKGDLYTYTNTDARLPVGTDGQFLSADSGQPTGLKWSNISGSSVSLTATEIAFGSAGNTMTSSANFVTDGNKMSIGAGIVGGYNGPYANGYNARGDGLMFMAESGSANGSAQYTVRALGISSARKIQGAWTSYSYFFPGNYTGTSLPFAYSMNLDASENSTYAPSATGMMVTSSITHIDLIGNTSTNIGTRLDAIGFYIAPMSTLNNANANLFSAIGSSFTRLDLNDAAERLRLTSTNGQPIFEIVSPGNSSSMQMFTSGISAFNGGATGTFNIRPEGTTALTVSTFGIQLQPGYLANFGNASTTNQMLVRIGQGTSTIDLGEASSNIPAIWMQQLTPDPSNYTLRATSTTATLNGQNAVVLAVGNSGIMSINIDNEFLFNPGATNTGADPTYTFVSPANINQTASANIPVFLFQGGVKTWSTGTLNTQYFNYFKANTVAFNAASTAVNVYANFMEKAIVGTNATIQSNWALGLDGDLEVGNNSNIYLNGGSNQFIQSAGNLRLKAAGGAEVIFDIIAGGTPFRVSGTRVKVVSGVGFELGNSAVTGLVPGVLAATTNASIVITDDAGQAYRIPCII